MSDATTTKANTPTRYQRPEPVIDLGAELEIAKAAHLEVMKSLGKGCKAAIEAGEALNKIKRSKLVPHGEWMDYVEEVCGIPDRTARRYMDLAKQKPLIEQRLGGKMANLATLTQTDVKRMISTRLPKQKATEEPGEQDQKKPPRAIKFETFKSSWNWSKVSEEDKQKFKDLFLELAA